MRESVIALVTEARAGNLKPDEVQREVQKEFISQALTDSNFNQCRAARDLGMHRNTLARQCEALNLDVDVLRQSKKPVAAVAAVTVEQHRSA